MINKRLIKKIKYSIYIAICIVIFILINNHKIIFHKCEEYFYKKATEYDITLQNISIKGIKNFNQKEIVSLFSKDFGKPLYSIDIKKKIQDISQITWVQNVAIGIKYPNKILIKIAEKIPVAYWQFNNQINLIDINGNIIQTKKIFFGKPLLIGKSANNNAMPFVRLLHKYKFFKIKYATFIGERRWNVTMDDEIILKLPENDIEAAIKKYLELASTTPIDNESVLSIDMRYIKDNKIHIHSKKTIRKKNEI